MADFPPPLSRTLVLTQRAVGKGNQIYSCQLPTVTFGILWMPLLGGLKFTSWQKTSHTHTHTPFTLPKQESLVDSRVQLTCHFRVERLHHLLLPKSL